MYRKEYAGEQTGVTAQRLANEPIRQAGFAITRSMAELIINKDALELQKDAALDEGDRKRREQWRINRQSPIPGPTPIPQPLEAEPGIGGLLAQLAIAGATSYIGGQLNKGNNPFNPGGNKVPTVKGVPSELSNLPKGYGGGPIPAYIGPDGQPLTRNQLNRFKESTFGN